MIAVEHSSKTLRLTQVWHAWHPDVLQWTYCDSLYLTCTSVNVLWQPLTYMYFSERTVTASNLHVLQWTYCDSLYLTCTSVKVLWQPLPYMYFSECTVTASTLHVLQWTYCDSLYLTCTSVNVLWQPLPYMYFSERTVTASTLHVLQWMYFDSLYLTCTSVNVLWQPLPYMYLHLWDAYTDPSPSGSECPLVLWGLRGLHAVVSFSGCYSAEYILSILVVCLNPFWPNLIG